MSYEINGHTYIKRYYRPNGIYPPWYNFVKTISNPSCEMKNMQGRLPKNKRVVEKDVERAFGGLQSRLSYCAAPC